MKILLIADIHGYFEKLEEFLDYAKKERFDMVICPGDFTDMFAIPKEFSQTDIANLIIQKLLTLKKPLLCTPGNHDPYEIVDLFDDYKINLHAKVREINGTRFLGWGGALTPFNTVFEPTNEETKETLESLSKKVTPGDFILITHDPPKNTNVDVASSGAHVGSPVIREFIEKYQPVLAVSAHIHESPGKDKIGKTTLFYPGALFNGYYGLIEIDGENIKCEQKTFGKQ